MCIKFVREILIDVMVGAGLVDEGVVVFVKVVVVVAIVDVVVVAVVVMVVVVGVSTGNSTVLLTVVSTGNSIPVMAFCFCGAPNLPNLCGDVGLWCPACCGGESLHPCSACVEDGSSWAVGTSDSQTDRSTLFKLCTFAVLMLNTCVFLPAYSNDR